MSETRRLLVVDDSPTQLAALADLLEAAGFETEGAGDAEAALEATRSGGFDMVLSDVVMPGRSGYDLCRDIKAEVDPAPAVVLLTSLSDPVDIVKGLEAGADNYITKPYDAASLVGRIEHVLENRRMRAEAPADGDADAVSIRFLGRTFSISASREQILELLLSSFEELVRTNDALQESQRALDQAHRRELAAEQLGRRSAESMARRMELLARASGLFASATDVDEVFARMVEVVVPELADGCIAFVYDDDGNLRRVGAAYGGGASGEVSRALDGHVDVALIDPLPPELARALVPDGSDPGACEALAVPMAARGRRAGVAVFGRCSGGFTPEGEDAAVAREIAGRAAMAVDALQLLAQETAARSAAENAARLRDEVLATVSHDLRNPIGVVVTASALLLELPLSEEEQRRQLGVIHRSGERATRLIDDLLDVSTMESGRFSVDREVVRPADLFDEAREMMGPLAGERGVDLAFSDADDLPPVRADRSRTLQVFSNLVGNALKFSSEGGRVRVLAEEEDGAVRFSVVDDGPGIAPDDLPHIFDRFWQAGGAHGGGGAGLGLAIVRGIVEAHDGDVDANSRPGEGATFSFTLPLADRGSVAPSQPTT